MENLSIEYVYKDGLKSPLKTLYFCRHCMELRSLECVYQHVRYKFNNIFDIRIYFQNNSVVFTVPTYHLAYYNTISYSL